MVSRENTVAYLNNVKRRRRRLTENEPVFTSETEIAWDDGSVISWSAGEPEPDFLAWDD